MVQSVNPQLGKLGPSIGGALDIVRDYLPLPDLLRLSSTCKEYDSLRKDDRFWRRLLIRDFGKESIPAQDLFTAYKTHHKIVKRICNSFHDQDIPGIKCFHIIKALKMCLQINYGLDFNIVHRIKAFLRSSENCFIAEKSINLMEDERGIKSYFLRMISASYINAGNLAEAERVALLIPDLYLKNSILAAIADGYSQVSNFAEAERVVMLIPGPSWKSPALRNIAWGYSQAGNFAGAERVAMLIPDPSERSFTLRLVAKGYIQAGNFAGAERVAMLIPDPSERSLALRLVAEVYIQAGNLDDDAERVAMLIPRPSERSLALRLVAERYIQAGNLDDAERIGPSPLCQRFIRCVRNSVTKNNILTYLVLVTGVATIAYKSLFGQSEE
jgi:hypothetical protein